MIKIAMWLNGIEKFKTKERALKTLCSYYAGLELDDTWADDLDKARKEIEAGSTRLVLDGRFNVSYSIEEDGLILNYLEYREELPDGFFNENRPTIKALVLGNVYEFKTKDEAIEGLKELLPKVIEDDKKRGKYAHDRETERFLINLELIKRGATRVVDVHSDIPEGFYEPDFSDDEDFEDPPEEPFFIDERSQIQNGYYDQCPKEELVEVVMGRSIHVFKNKEDAIKKVASQYTTLDMVFYESDKMELDKACEELVTGNKRVVLDGHTIPDDFFDEKNESIKMLIFGEVLEFKTKEEAIGKLEQLLAEPPTLGKKTVHKGMEASRCEFNIELLQKGATRVVDWDSKIPENFYD